MSGIGNTFGEMNNSFGSHTDQRLSIEENGRLCLYKAPSGDGGGEVDLEERRRKCQRGAQVVIETLDRQFGVSVRNRVLGNVQDQVSGRDVREEMTGGDLSKITIELRGRTPLKRELDDNQRLQKEAFGTGPTDRPGTVERQVGADLRLSELFGRPLTDDEIRGLGGIPDRCSVELVLVDLSQDRHFQGRDQGVCIEMTGGSEDFETIEVTVYRDRDGHVHLYQDSIEVNPSKKDRATHLGGCVLMKQVDTARSLDVQTIHNFSAKGNYYNGYYTWARYGGNASLTDDRIHYYDGKNPGELDRTKTNLIDGFQATVKALRDALSNPRTTFEKVRELGFEVEWSDFEAVMNGLAGKNDLDIQDLMRTPEGRAVWRVFGSSFPLEFEVDTVDTVPSFRDYTMPNSCFELH